MRCVIQRVSEASVTIAEKVKSSIGLGLLVLIGIEETDNDEDIEWLCGKISKLRIFNDEAGVMNCSVMDLNGDILLITGEFGADMKVRLLNDGPVTIIIDSKNRE